MPYKPPQNLWEVSEQLRYNEPLLDANDPRYVDTSPGRTLGYERLFRSLGVDSATDTLKVKHPSQYHLFCGDSRVRQEHRVAATEAALE